MLQLVNQPYGNNAQIELTRRSLVLEERLRPITAEMNAHRLRVNRTTWQANCEAAEESANFLIDYARYLADDDYFRPNSRADCQKALGIEKTDADSLSELFSEGVSLAGVVAEARSAICRWGQMKAWRPFAELGMVQATWDSLGTPHGRYTSDSPCLNNRIVPIRETIESDPGYSFLSLDLSQAEYVSWASLSGDPALGKSFREGKDFHVEMAESIRAMVPGRDLHGETPRQAGKTINFAVLYQMQPRTLARRLGCSVQIATQIIEAYYARVRTAALYIECVLAAAKRTGFVETYYGRRRYCSEYQEVTGDREAHEVAKTLWNHVNAGTAAEFLKWKQVHVWEQLRQAGFNEEDVRLSIQNYDECIWHVRDQVLPEVKEIAETIWRRQEPGFLPFQATVQTGMTWGEVSK